MVNDFIQKLYSKIYVRWLHYEAEEQAMRNGRPFCRCYKEVSEAYASFKRKDI